MLQTWGTRIAFGLVAIAGLSGCSSIGPRSIARDRFDYVTAISESWKEQMLLNLVKIRYADAPVFLDVGSIITQYAVESELSLGGTWNKPHAVGPSYQVPASVKGKFTDRPTITYSPIGGEKLTRSFMTPIRPESLFALVQAGWPVDYVLRLAVHSINGLRNHVGGALRSRPAEPDFLKVLETLRRLQIAGGMDFRLVRRENEELLIVTFPRREGDSLQEDSALLRKLLGVRADAVEIRLVYGSRAQSDEEIAILSRSIFDIITELAFHIDVPAEHVADGRAAAAGAADSTSGLPPLIRIHSGRTGPDDPFATIAYRGHHFWIDDTDFASKRTFSLLMMLFSLTELEGKSAAPIVTIPAG
ncbi:MAG: hypothetical protein JXP34_28275 [Planctomycetes bacterium]|nr:hypothetical protein [Planctomycetota bacterium]